MKRALLVIAAAAVVAGFTVPAYCCRGPGTREVTIGMRYSHFSPARLTVKRGDRVRFTLRNDDPIAHEFILGTEAEQLQHERSGDATHDGAPGTASLEPGETQVVAFQFDRAGALIFGCHRPGHYAYGMRGVVDVRA